MLRILKYPCGWDGNRKAWWAMMPPGQIIRTEYIDDGCYKGYWVWAVVGDEPAKLRTFQWLPKREESKNVFNKEIQLGILESQRVTLEDYPFDQVVKVIDGKIFLWYDTVVHSPAMFEILGYKTGQEIKVDISKCEYIGFAPLIIKNEIAIYFFLRKV